MGDLTSADNSNWPACTPFTAKGWHACGGWLYAEGVQRSPGSRSAPWVATTSTSCFQPNTLPQGHTARRSCSALVGLFTDRFCYTLSFGKHRERI